MSILCIGSAVLDITAQPVGDSSTWKEKQRISSVQMSVGGDAANQAVRLADLGLSVSLVTCVGDDTNGLMLRASLEARGIDMKYVDVKPKCGTCTSIVLVSEEGERRIFSTKGAHSLISSEDCSKCLAQEIEAVSLGSLYSMPVLEEHGLVEFLQEIRGRGIPVFADLASDKKHQRLEGIRQFLPYIDYFLPSVYDALEMTKAADAEEAARIYHGLGVRNVIIKCGSRGVYYYCSHGCGWADALNVKPRDTTGAGDCMVAWFISRILAGDGIAQACRYACLGATYSTLFLGASARKITEEEVQNWSKGHLSDNEEGESI